MNRNENNDFFFLEQMDKKKRRKEVLVLILLQHLTICVGWIKILLALLLIFRWLLAL